MELTCAPSKLILLNCRDHAVGTDSDTASDGCFCLLGDADQAQQHVRLTYLGTAGWEITDGKVIVLVDPYFSRVKRRIPYADVSADDPRPVPTDDDLLTSDRAVIDTHITRADFILITHTHSDHVMDTPYIAQKTGAIIIGTQSTTNFLRASGISNSQLITVKGGEDMDLGVFSVRVVPSLHGTFRRLPQSSRAERFQSATPRSVSGKCEAAIPFFRSCA